MIDLYRRMRLPTLQIGFYLVALILAAPVSAQFLGPGTSTAGRPGDGPAGIAQVGSRDENNKLQFDFLGAAWQEVLSWLASEANLNLEWSELPDGEFNLQAEHEYTVAESLDIINMHLLSRGFTLMRRGEVLILMKLDEGFDAMLVPRVETDDLDRFGQFEFAKVSFALDWMLAEVAAKELAPMLSRYGTLVPLTKTNRIEAMDRAGNLREIRDLLQREESGNSQERLVAEFPLQHTVAAEIIGKLNQLLGAERPLARMSEDQMRVVREQYAFKTELAKRLGDDAPNLRDSPNDVYLVANEQRNSIVANAPPDKVAMIRQAVQVLDVPSTNGATRLSEITTMKVYPLNGADPDAVVDILEDLVEVGELHPSARFSEDDDKQIVFAFASLRDHVTISSVMDQLEGSSRSFRVIKLHRLKAAYVARSIETLMGAEVSSSTSSERDRDRRNRGSESSWSGFKANADIPNNRLLLFATDAEYAQVEQLLVNIGERSRVNSGTRVMRVPPASMEEMLEEVRTHWPSVSDNPLDIRTSPDQPELDNSTSNAGSDLEPAEPEAAYLVFNQSADADRELKDLLGPMAPEDKLPSAPPVILRKAAEDELVIRSLDADALQQMESLLAGFLPQDPPYVNFSLKHMAPYLVETKLLQVFGSDSAGTASPIKFVTDEATRSIMVLGAGPAELKEIGDLIEFYDQPPRIDPSMERKPRFIQLNHARAPAVIAAVKNLYRDYLSVNDPDLLPQNRDRSPAPVSTLNSGLLSLGMYPDTNIVIVYAPEYLAQEVAKTITGLDVPDAATVIRVESMGYGLYSADTRAQLSKLLKLPDVPANNALGAGNIPRRAERAREDEGEEDNGAAEARSSGR